MSVTMVLTTNGEELDIDIDATDGDKVELWVANKMTELLNDYMGFEVEEIKE